MDQQGSGLAAVGSLGDPVRRSLYEFVAGSPGPVGRDEAATAAGIGRPLAAYHLDKLVSQGLLAASYQRPAGRGGPGAGRPAKGYARSGSEFGATVPPREYELAAPPLAGTTRRPPCSRGPSKPTAAAPAGPRCTASPGSSVPISGGAARPLSPAGRAPCSPRRTRCSPRRTRCAGTASSRGTTRMARSGCVTAHSTGWPPSTPRSS